MATRSDDLLDDFILKSNEALAPLLLPLSALEKAMFLDDLADDLANQVRLHVRDARSEGVTWDVIGTVFGVTRSAVHQRFGR